MDDDPHEQMHRVLNQRQTSELLDIWQKNDRQEWSKQAMDVAGEILQERQVALPPQNMAVGQDAYEVANEMPPAGEVIEESSLEDSPPEFVPEPDRASQGCLAALAQSLFSGGGGGAYRPRVHRTFRPRVHAAAPHIRRPARPAPVHRSVAKGRHK